MAKWADYLIASVSFNGAHTHINRVRAHPDNGDSVGPVAEYERATIVAAIEKGTTFVTIFKNASGNWAKGQVVYIINVNGTKYLKTVDNGKPIDNLDNLPEF
jgi:hypothetical protein